MKHTLRLTFIQTGRHLIARLSSLLIIMLTFDITNCFNLTYSTTAATNVAIARAALSQIKHLESAQASFDISKIANISFIYSLHKFSLYILHYAS